MTRIIRLQWSWQGTDLPGGAESPPSQISPLMLLPCHTAGLLSVTTTATASVSFFPEKKKPKTNAEWSNSGKTFSVSDISSEKGSEQQTQVSAAPSRRLQPHPCLLQLQRKVMSLPPGHQLGSSSTYVPRTLPPPPGPACWRMALVTRHSRAPSPAGPHRTGWALQTGCNTSTR